MGQYFNDYASPPHAHRTGHDLANLIHQYHADCRKKASDKPTRFIMALDIKHLRVLRDGRPAWPNTPDLMQKALQQLDAVIYDLVPAIYSASIDRNARRSIHMVAHPRGGPSEIFLIGRAVDLFN